MLNDWESQLQRFWHIAPRENVVSIESATEGSGAAEAEGEKVYYNFKRKEEWLGNLGLKMNFTPNAGVMLAVIFQDDETPCRILKVEYASSF